MCVLLRGPALMAVDLAGHRGLRGKILQAAGMRAELRWLRGPASWLHSWPGRLHLGPGLFQALDQVLGLSLGLGLCLSLGVLRGICIALHMLGGR